MQVTLAGTVLVVALSGGVGSTQRELVLGALAPAPQKVVLETRSFGTVTVDHAAHLARRASCKSCHGPGPVTKVGRFEPKVAHDRCIGCHKQEAKGPTGCRECHAVPAAATTVAEASSTSTTSPTAEATATVTSPSASNALPAPGLAGTSGGTADLAALRPPPHEAEGVVRQSRFVRVVGVGYAVLGGPGQDLATGPAVSFSMREGDVLLLYALERGSSKAGGRTLGLVGAGLTRPVWNGWSAFAAALGGFDAGEAPVSVVPNLGLRSGVEWLGRRTSFTLAVTAATDLVRQTNGLGEQVGGTTFSFGATVGYVISRD